MTELRKKIKKLIYNPRRIIYSLGYRGFFNWLPDLLYLKMVYRSQTGKRLDLENPITFNEKLQWLKLNNKDKSYSPLVDKYAVRKYISDIIGSQYLIPLLGLYDDVEEINLDDLPNKFVIKCTHDSGGVFICENKKTFNFSLVKKKIKKRLKKNYFWAGREYPYKDIQPRIIIEKYMEDVKEEQLKDFKFFCFNGEPEFLFIASDRGDKTTKFDFFDIDFNKIPVKQHYKNSEKEIEKPKNFEKMIELSKQLSTEIPQVRIDFYEIDGKIYFGEFTFFHFSGLENFEPDYFDSFFGEYINLK